MIKRKEFLRTLGCSAAAAVVGGVWPVAAKPVPAESLTLGLASYTFRKFSLEETIGFAQRVGLKRIALKSMHLPLDASPGQIKDAVSKVKAAGLELYGAGVIYMKTKEEVDQAFGYARHAGLQVIIGVPNHELLPYTEQKVKESNIRLAIHNHGPGDDLYSSVNDIHDKIKNLDNRIGICIDIGHVVRIKEDPAAMVLKYKDRIYDCHLKDEDKAEAEGKPVEAGRGVIDLPAFLKAMKQINYSGTLAFEYEKDGDDPLPGLAESVGYVRGVMDVME
ncbi:MAG: sugar phosphate isomerase/epimerase [Cyclobacteriaceae bacterium]|jgi:sugar phosphate isomerase/epimerase|nr:sugar phosphate isomerase/epimerase [Cyclobacteriaceae bacterium]